MNRETVIVIDFGGQEDEVLRFPKCEQDCGNAKHAAIRVKRMYRCKKCRGHS